MTATSQHLTRAVSKGDHTLRVRSEGAGPRQFLALHGLVDSLDIWQRLAPALASRGRVTRYDQRGHGNSGAPSGPYSREDLAADAVSVLDSLEIDRAILLGHSMGGGGTFHLAIKDPSPWAGLAPIAPAYYGDPSTLEKIRKLPVIMVQGDKDRLVKVTRVRPLAEKMKELGMDYEYIEVKGGGHVLIAFENLPKIFEFFNKHTKP